MTTTWLDEVFHVAKPVIAMLHLSALPGDPGYDSAGGIAAVVERARAELDALQSGGVDGIMISNEFSLPYLTKTEPITAITMARIIGELLPDITVPYGVNVLWDPMSTIALAAATGASFVREIFTGSYASDMGPWTPDAGKAMRYRDRLGRPDLAMLYNVSAEFAYSLDQRPLPDRARSAVFSSIPDAILVSGQITGEAARMEDLEAVKKALPDTPVLANTGVKHATIAQVMKVADGCIVGSSLKVDGNTWNAVDAERARDFMARARAARGE